MTAIDMPHHTHAQIVARNAAITSARHQLAAASNKSLSPAVVQRVDQLLGLPATNPRLGVR